MVQVHKWRGTATYLLEGVLSEGNRIAGLDVSSRLRQLCLEILLSIQGKIMREM